METKTLGTHFEYLTKEEKAVCSVPENYTPWLGEYIKDTHVPLFKHIKSTCKFILNSMYIGLPVLYATNKEVLEDVGRILTLLDVSYEIKPYVNLECRYEMWIDKNVFDILKEIVNGN